MVCECLMKFTSQTNNLAVSVLFLEAQQPPCLMQEIDVKIGIVNPECSSIMMLILALLVHDPFMVTNSLTR